MAFEPGFYIPDSTPPAPGGTGDIEIDPAALAKLKQALQSAAEELETDRFSDIHLGESVFGASPAGTELSTEHRTAHAIIADTIQGVVTDLWGYRAGVEQFEAGMGNADDTAAADLRVSESAVDALAYSAASNHGESSYRNAQVDNLPPGAGDGGASQGAEGASEGSAGGGPDATDGDN